MKTQIKAEIVAHSINEQGDELISVLATFPRIILAEVNTHRMLSKNTSSSRAIPFNKMVEAIQDNPFIPIAWQKHHSGMQGNEYHTGEGNVGDINYKARAERNWLRARDFAVEQAKHLYEDSLVTKQLCNRLLEPFMWTTMLITGPKSGWENFFKLRCPQYETNSGKGFRSRKDALAAQLDVKDPGKDFVKQTYEEGFNIEWLLANRGQAEIHIMALAECIWDAVNESTPKQLKAGEWHIPFEDKINIPLEGTEFATEAELQEYKMKISVAMAARTSYTVVGEEKEINYEAMIKLHDKLLAQDPPHSSPLEHCAKAMSEAERQMYRKVEKTKSDSEGLGWCNNLKGFIPYRYMVDNAQL